MDEEMMAVLGAAATTDPVSGNNVPPGSMPEEVRDDIDARLSEGEYVVPADVVRYFGVRVFEDMRKEAKIGLAQMDADGRIGGKPPTEQPRGNEAISDDEVELLESMLSSQGLAAGGLAKGGMLDKLINAATTDPMVNSRLQAAGMAVGGVVGQKMPTQSLYSELPVQHNKTQTLCVSLVSVALLFQLLLLHKPLSKWQQQIALKKLLTLL